MLVHAQIASSALSCSRCQTARFARPVLGEREPMIEDGPKRGFAKSSGHAHYQARRGREKECDEDQLGRAETGVSNQSDE